MSAAAADFLSLLFGSAELSGLSVAIWDRQTKSTHAFTLPDGIAAAAADAEARGLSNDVYFGTCPYSEIATGSRGTAEHAGALVGLWLDVDVREGSAHKSSALPETDAQALDLIEAMPARASRIVSSGYGFQAWWLFDRPMLLRSAEDRVRAARMTTGWVDTANALAAGHGWKLDPVGDLARVLRVPGTFNRKGAEPRAVTIIC